ncbi:MAG: flap endonuclease-1 [Candidatus Micrarchaeota archaeon]|nr:flap endonuclease-1 [Candidatus Micrarchaeota archaeon]
MAVDLSKLVYKRKIDLEELRGKTVAIDAYNVLYQFLSIIRQPDGTPLMGPSGEVTSHLSGLFYRTIEMVEKGIRPIYVFDGVPSSLKQRTIEARMNRKKEALAEFEKAKQAGDIELMRSKAMATTRITREIAESGRRLLELMGIGCIKAPSEGEAQASWMASRGLVYAAGSQDYDTMLFGAPRVVRNLTFSGRRKLPMKNIYVNVEPEMMELDRTLNDLGISRDQLIWIGILIGTDFNEGINGVGPKTALKIAKASKTINDVEKYVGDKLKKSFELDIREVEELFKKPEIREVEGSEVSKLLKLRCDPEATVKFMCGEHGFSEERISKALERINSETMNVKQSGIDSWL